MPESLRVFSADVFPNQTFFPPACLSHRLCICCVGADDKMCCKSASIYTSAKLLSTSISCSNDRPWFECVKQESRSNRSFSISHNQIIISGCCKKFAVTSLPVAGQHMLQIHRCCKIFATFLRFKSLIKWEKPPCLYILRS